VDAITLGEPQSPTAAMDEALEDDEGEPDNGAEAGAPAVPGAPPRKRKRRRRRGERKERGGTDAASPAGTEADGAPEPGEPSSDDRPTTSPADVDRSPYAVSPIVTPPPLPQPAAAPAPASPPPLPPSSSSSEPPE
jgi:hypothetical protein